MNLGVIDLGSNTVRLCVYDVSSDGSKFKTIMNRKIVAGLAAYIDGGVISDEGIAEATSAVRKCLKRAAYLNPERVEVFATAVLRNISNSRAAIKAIERGADCHISLLSERDEAHLGFVGAASCVSLKEGMLIDIGGGSTELTVVEGGRDVLCTSLPQGSLSSYKRFVSNILPTFDEALAIRASARELIAADESGIAGTKQPKLFGVGGSIRALAEVNARLIEGAPNDMLTFGDVARLSLYALEGRRDFVEAVLQVAPERIHTLCCGLAILSEIFEEFGGQDVRVCDRGVREGYLLERMLKL